MHDGCCQAAVLGGSLYVFKKHAPPDRKNGSMNGFACDVYYPISDSWLAIASMGKELGCTLAVAAGSLYALAI